MTNANDFSWRNRIYAYQGALQVMADHPLAGVGWRNATQQFDCFYSPPKLTDYWGIILNDYLMIGMTLGIPALGCFLACLWTSQKAEEKQKKLNWEARWLKVGCRAGIIVLLIGFWFDGGLFKLALAMPFWLLLELGRGNPALIERKT